MILRGVLAGLMETEACSMSSGSLEAAYSNVLLLAGREKRRGEYASEGDTPPTFGLRGDTGYLMKESTPNIIKPITQQSEQYPRRGASLHKNLLNPHVPNVPHVFGRPA